MKRPKMPKLTRKKISGIHSQIREILLREWDPIGISQIPEACNEYDRYVPRVHRVFLDKHSAVAVADYFASLEADSMGLTPRKRSKLLPVAQRLVAACKLQEE